MTAPLSRMPQVYARVGGASTPIQAVAASARTARPGHPRTGD
ncbi:hypothetical protein ACFSEO_01895 [Agromyces cerinus subsp. nitratus]